MKARVNKSIISDNDEILMVQSFCDELRRIQKLPESEQVEEVSKVRAEICDTIGAIKFTQEIENELWRVWESIEWKPITQSIEDALHDACFESLKSAEDKYDAALERQHRKSESLTSIFV